MAAKNNKSAGKTGKKKAAPKKKAGAKKAAPKKPAKRAPEPKKKAAAKPAPKPRPKAAPTKPSVPPTAPKAVPAPAPAPVAPPAGGVSAADVNLGHVVALRPRTHTGFKPEAFAEAKRALAEQRFASIDDAARAVAEKATELSNESGPDPFSTH
jgi:hypothetical protein